MRYQPIPNSLFIKNRKKLGSQLKDGAVAILCSNEVLPTNADGVFGFKQNSDLFYLCGIDQEETYLILQPNHPVESHREILFIRETNDHLKIWEGEKLSKEQAREISGIEKVLWSHQLDGYLKRTLPEAKSIYLNANEHDGRNTEFRTKSEEFNQKVMAAYPLFEVNRLAPILGELRLIKEKEEIDQLRKALAITKKGFLRLADKITPDIHEFELEAHLTHEFLINRSRGHAFPPIMASGKNACVLHYVTNNEVCKDGDLILMDFGAEYANYNADITRCLPVNGKFTERQKLVYKAVLNVFHFAKERIVAGNTMEKLREETSQKMEAELIKLGLLKKEDVEKQKPESPLYRKYFPHSISHHLGLDVHDVGSRYAVFQPGMVLTCEPGIYIEEECLGVRLENDILITEDGNEDLCSDIPLEIGEIEALFKSGKI
ncbi:aminopeptidase P N-terminal domain-containing protein [Jiulongibacter sediminis]|uniref:Xaa-Pro aminopeptidase n=1 Tax=Jiulongibacter sediminis TaxID=1605367 RepID=A0A0P7C9W5_9BACT|nr:aminopeptidase P N-terminal domain-containing protein [Jiulongibacter sediminis]KPM49363.1 X-Pro aminopeptidase [Jiulongibacter sediminis]TBX26412.1 X-Pro aminopeptidase [Jiulongibacter sediminis]